MSRKQTNANRQVVAIEIRGKTVETMKKLVALDFVRLLDMETNKMFLSGGSYLLPVEYMTDCC